MMGRGVSQNDEEAAGWYRKAAEAGDPLGEFMLAQMYRDGRGVKKDYQAAYKWFAIAVANGNEIDGRKYLKDKLDKEEIARAEAAAQDWLKAHPAK